MKQFMDFLMHKYITEWAWYKRNTELQNESQISINVYFLNLYKQKIFNNKQIKKNIFMNLWNLIFFYLNYLFSAMKKKKNASNIFFSSNPRYIMD